MEEPVTTAVVRGDRHPDRSPTRVTSGRQLTLAMSTE